MLWNRYADPIRMLRTYSLTGAIAHVQYLIEKDNDDKIWQMWLHRKPKKTVGKDQQYISFEELKQTTLTTQKQVAEDLTPEIEAERMDFASQFIKTKESSDGSI